MIRVGVVFALATTTFFPIVGWSQCSPCAHVNDHLQGEAVNPFFGINEKNNHTLDVYISPEIVTFPPSRISPNAIDGALQQWRDGCGERLPDFNLHSEGGIPQDRDVTTSIAIVYDFMATTPGSGTGAHVLAEQSGSEIRLFGLCATSEPYCDSQGRIIWTQPYTVQIIAHEIGHTFGLGHDDSAKGCTEETLMKEVTKYNELLGIHGEQCDLAGRLNDGGQTCGLGNDLLVNHPCEVCQYKLSGNVSGIPPGVVASLTLTIPDNGGTYTESVFSANTEHGFDIGVPDGFSYSVTVESSNPDVVCEVANSSGTVNGADVTNLDLTCECTAEVPPSTDGVSAFGESACGEIERGELFDPDERPEPVFDLCLFYPRFCSIDLDPWWFENPGPPLGDGPCENEPNCTDDGQTCAPHPDTGEEICGGKLTCKPTCGNSTAILTLLGPSVAVDNLGSTASGVVHLTGFARDVDGLLDFWIYVDGVKVSSERIETGLLRPDACAGVTGDCDPFSGFAAELDTTSWTDGTHRFDIIALDAEPDYPMGTRIVREVTVDNTCTSTSVPTVAITEPIAGAVLAGPVSVRATASGETPVARVQYYLDGVRVTTDWVAPYEWQWDTTTVPDGFHELRARAVDRCGVGTDSAPVVVEVLNANDAPRVELETPIAWATLAGTTVEVSGWALDEDGIASVSLRLNGQVVATAGAPEVRERAEVCSAFGSPDPRCPNVGWALRFDSTQVPDGAYTLQVVVTDGRDGTASMSRQVTIGNAPPAPPGVSVPQSVTAALGDTVVFQVTASGAGPFTYQWQERRDARWGNLAEGDRGGRVTGVATSAMTVTALEYGDAGGYRCMVTNAGGARASGSASLTVVDSIEVPTVTSGIDQLVVEGGDAQLTVSAEGFAPLSYRWQKWNGSAYLDLTSGGGITGTTGPVLSITGTTLAHGGLYRCRVTNPGGTTVSAPIRLTVDPDLTGSCIASPTKLCLLHDRFRAEVVINGSAGQVRPYSNLGGFFTLGNPNNVEVAVKVLDGVSVNGRYWVFHGSMTSHAYTLTVTDTVTGATKTYHKAAGSFCGVADTAAFSNPESGGAPLLAALVVPLRTTAASTTGSCQSTTTAQCLLGDRFRVQVFRNGSAQRAVPVSALSAAFTFGSTANPEVVAKVLDGTVVNDWYWVFFGSLTGQAYEVRVTDTTDGTVKVYPSPGPSCGQADTTAF